jgi:hypothetical protein
MSISKTWVANTLNVQKTVALYRDRRMLTVEQIAEKLQTTFHNVSHVLRANVPTAERKALAALRYSRSKEAEKNPMFGKCGEDHPNWIGVCEDGNGYLTILVDGVRCLLHRVIMAKALGLERLPDIFDVHHIDTDTKNNRLDNLALVTPAGHKTIHYLQAKDSKDLVLKKLKLWEATQFMT